MVIMSASVSVRNANVNEAIDKMTVWIAYMKWI